MKKIENGKGRLNLRIPADLLTWAKQYTARKNTNVTQVIVDYLTELQKKDRSFKKDAEQF